jgi:hypothetical protein
MPTGKRFRLKTAVLALETSDGKRIAITVPPEAIIEVMRGPLLENMWMVDVRWNGRALVMFADDVQEYGQEVSDRAAGAN